MSDLYYKDTKKKLEDFDDAITELSDILDKRFVHLFEELVNETESLLVEYESKCDDLEHAKQLLEENGIED